MFNIIWIRTQNVRVEVEDTDHWTSTITLSIEFN